MASLKELRSRITGVKSTRKITSAMKMVAISKLRRAQLQAEAAKPYAETMRRMMGEMMVAMQKEDQSILPPLLVGTGQDRTHLLVVMTSDRGLAGGFSSNVIRMVRSVISDLKKQGKTVRLLPVGRKGADILARYYPDDIVGNFRSVAGKTVTYEHAVAIAENIIAMLNKGEIDCCTLFRNRFVNAMTQIPERIGLIPLALPENTQANDNQPSQTNTMKASVEFEPDEESLLSHLLPRNLEVQIFSALLENAAGEQGARMTAMDNASRNAGKAIDRLSLTYNRTRQANITNELIEIISGAEAV